MTWSSSTTSKPCRSDGGSSASKKTALIAISMGDPAGIGAEVILKAAGAFATRRGAPTMVVIGDLAAMRAAAERLGGSLRNLTNGLPARRRNRAPTDWRY